MHIFIVSQITTTKPDYFTPRVVEKKDDYIRVEYESPILGVKLFNCPGFMMINRQELCVELVCIVSVCG